MSNSICPSSESNPSRRICHLRAVLLGHVADMDGGGDTSPASSPARTGNNVSHYTPASRFGFSMMWNKFCHSCFEITLRTALAQFEHFTLKARVRFQKGGRPPKLPPWVRHWVTHLVFGTICPHLFVSFDWQGDMHFLP